MKVAKDGFSIKRNEHVDLINMRTQRFVANPYGKVAVFALDVGIVFPFAK